VGTNIILIIKISVSAGCEMIFNLACLFLSKISPSAYVIMDFYIPILEIDLK
jgi:hypothetical protein